MKSNNLFLKDFQKKLFPFFQVPLFAFSRTVYRIGDPCLCQLEFWKLKLPKKLCETNSFLSMFQKSLPNSPNLWNFELLVISTLDSVECQRTSFSPKLLKDKFFQLKAFPRYFRGNISISLSWVKIYLTFALQLILRIYRVFQK